jgi:hypothetical protein
LAMVGQEEQAHKAELGDRQRSDGIETHTEHETPL